MSVFDDLVLRDSNDRVHLLDINAGTLKQIAESLLGFESDASLRRKVLFADVAESLFAQGWKLEEGKCFGYKTPVVFTGSGGINDNIYVADIREYVAFMGDLHQQLKSVPDGSKVRLVTRNT